MKKFLPIFLFILLVFPTVALAAPRTSTVFKSASGSGGVDIFPYLALDRKQIIVDFQSPNLGSVEYISYTLSYGTSGQGLKGAAGTIVPNKDNFKYYNRVPYIRQIITLGTCSKTVCVYDPGAKNFNITINTKYKDDKKVYTKAYNIF